MPGDDEPHRVSAALSDYYRVIHRAMFGPDPVAERTLTTAVHRSQGTRNGQSSTLIAVGVPRMQLLSVWTWLPYAFSANRLTILVKVSGTAHMNQNVALNRLARSRRVLCLSQPPFWPCDCPSACPCPA